MIHPYRIQAINAALAEARAAYATTETLAALARVHKLQRTRLRLLITNPDSGRREGARLRVRS